MSSAEPERLTGTAQRGMRLPAVLLGIGLGGFVDGIVLHQILQWHHMLSSRYLPDTVQRMSLNVRWDGFFHGLTWVAVLAGVLLMYARAVAAPGLRWSYRQLWGGLAFGWGAFNLVEGLIDHHLLQLHHVRPGPGQMWWDLSFLLLGGVLVVGGGWLLRSRP
jgi:uncharacterized membrane protein